MNTKFEKGEGKMKNGGLDRNGLVKKFDTAGLIEYLNDVIDSETAKSNEMDTGIIDECVDWLLELKGTEIKLSEEEIKKRVQGITKKHYRPKKRLLRFGYVAAVVVLLVLGVQTVSVVAFEQDFFGSMANWTKDMFVSLIGTNVQKDNTVVEVSHSRQYKTVEDFERTENIQILTPGYMPNGIKVKAVVYSYEYETKNVKIEYEDNMTFLDIKLSENLPNVENIAGIEYIENNGIVFYVDKNTNIILWEYANNFYTLICGFEIVEYDKIIINIK